ncbi:S-adenosyl-L-methionine-dependent methyltransferase [Stipitochalara longipes BDJ]|nr:S-adenosyl-L-methionine-dependent methyltransferase [Stipitochalara longipes BDJ]
MPDDKVSFPPPLFITKSYLLNHLKVEQDRLNLQHHLWLLTLNNRLSLAPLTSEPAHVLDLGTGTGIWAIDYALSHPTTQVLAINLTPSTPSSTPPNLTLHTLDFDSPSTWTSTSTFPQKFNLIHGRLLVSCLATALPLFNHAFTALAPGGWLEMQDTDFPSFAPDASLRGSRLEEWYSAIEAGFKGSLGRGLGVVRGYKSAMQEVGFVGVQEEFFVWPIGTWPRDPKLKELGYWYGKDMVELVKGLKAPFIRGLGWSLEEVEKFHEEVLKDVEGGKVHAYQLM